MAGCGVPLAFCPGPWGLAESFWLARTLKSPRKAIFLRMNHDQRRQELMGKYSLCPCSEWTIPMCLLHTLSGEPASDAQEIVFGLKSKLYHH